MGTSLSEFARHYERVLLKKDAKPTQATPTRTFNKYGAKKTTVDMIEFDSKSESEFYLKLMLFKRSGLIIKIELQPKYLLQEGFSDRHGVAHKPIYYIADFEVLYNDGTIKLYDSKGAKTKEYQLKKKLLLFRYPELIFEEVFFHETHPVSPKPLTATEIRTIKKQADEKSQSIVAARKKFALLARAKK